MKRDVTALANDEYDLLIIGGGINGVAAAWEAVLRGLRVCLIERNDFGGATSSQTARIAHSGMRYLQHADFKRLRESIRERNALVANAPHLVDALPFLLPVYGHGMKGLEAMSVYLKTFDLLSLDRRWFSDESRRIPSSQVVSASTVLEMAPTVRATKLTGGVIWSEGLMHNTERLVLAYVRSAVDSGARVANYVEATQINTANGRVTGAEVTDRLSGRSYQIRAKVVLNATGPWAVNTLVGGGQFRLADHGIHLSKAFSIVTRPLTRSFALSFASRSMYRDRKAVVEKGTSMHFAIPWRDMSLVGSLHLSCDDDPDSVCLTEAEVDTYLAMVNEGYPGANLQRSDVHRVLWGMIPAEEKGSAAPLKHDKIIDHQLTEQIRGLVTVVGVKFTTARAVAEEVINVVARHLDKPTAKSTSRKNALWGGDIDHLRRFATTAVQTFGGRLASEGVIQRLARNYGSRYVDIVRYMEQEPRLARTLPDSDVTQAEALYAARHEMTISLVDLVLRRTDLGATHRPTDACICACADLLARELGWDVARRGREIERLEQAYEIGPFSLRA